jgi:ABC-type glycerol-3-phosphate transport system substrate-binding protein
MRRKILSVMLSLALIMGMAGCGNGTSQAGKQGAPDDEIITTTAVDQGKTMVTIRVEFGAGQSSNLESVLEQKFPNVDIVLRHDGSTDSLYTLRANLEAGVECDLIMSRRLATISDVASEYLLDLSSESFVDNYYLTAIDSCTDNDTKLYYLPGPMDVYGIVYDKTMFEENGWKVPDSYTGFVSLLNQISAEKEGVTPFQVSMMYPDMFQIMFNTYNYESTYAGIDNYKWLSAYQTGQGSMVGHMESAVANFKKLREDGILSANALEVTPSTRSSMLYEDHTAAMIIECQNAVAYAKNYDCDHEIAMMPFFTSDSADGDFLYGIPSYYMAVNKSAAEESEQKKQILLDIYSYLSSVEGQEMLIGDDFQVSNVKGVAVNNNEFSENIMDTINKGNVINTFYFAEGETNKQVERAMLADLASVLDGTESVTDWLLSADEARNAFLTGDTTKEQPYGTVETTMTRLETAYTVAEMYADTMGTEIGLVRGGGWDESTNGYFYQGNITDSSLACLTPAKEADKSGREWADSIVKAKLTGQQIIDILNSSYEPENSKGLYPYYVVSGLNVEFNPWGTEGNRVISCKLADGTDIDRNAYYEVAYFNGSLPEGLDESVKPTSGTSLTWQESFLQWLSGKGGTLKKPEMMVKLKYS